MGTFELEKKNLLSKNAHSNKFLTDATKEFIGKNFMVRRCVKFKRKTDKLCICNKEEIEHKSRSPDNEEWSPENNTELIQCSTFGCIYFSGYEFKRPGCFPKFIRFDSLDNCESACENIYNLLTGEDLWNIRPPKLIISINGGLKKMKFISNQQRKNFKQGLTDVMKKDQTWVIGSGFNVGIHKLVSETIYEFRLHQEDLRDQVSLIGISTWGTVRNNDLLLEKPTNLKTKCEQSTENNPSKSHPVYKYEYHSSNVKGKVTLDSLYDSFLFCDDGTEKQYDKDIDFRLKFENIVKKNADGFLVQILFEGGKRAIKNACNSLRDNIPLVVIKGSGRAADIISEAMELTNKNVKENIDRLMNENRNILDFKEDPSGEAEYIEYTEYLVKMHNEYRNKVIIYDMMDTNVKFDKKILEAMILGAEKSLEKTLKLCIRFNCPNIADRFVFSKPGYGLMENIPKMFKTSLEENLPDFVNLFLENNFHIERFINLEVLKELYATSFDTNKCQCAELLTDLSKGSRASLSLKKSHFNSDFDILSDVGRIIEKLSGNILNNFYKSLPQPNIPVMSDELPFCDEMSEEEEEAVRERKLSSQDLFIWSLLSGKTTMSFMFWRSGRDHIGSALVASNILKYMADIVLVRGDNTLQSKLMTASKKYEDYAISILTEAYNRSKSKTYTMIVRALFPWSKLTCLKLALNGNMIDFLSHSACRSYTTKIWMGELSPFLPTWKIVLTIPFSFILMKLVIIPTFLRKRPIKKDANKNLVENQHCSNPSQSSNTNSVSFCKATAIFYRAPIVKFYIHLISYIVFLIIFTYSNLVELKYLANGIIFRDMLAEFYVYIYVLTFTAEEVRQVLDQKISGFCNKIKNYFSGTWNKFDVIIITLFISSTITRFTLSENHFTICRCLFSITLSLFFIRSMQFYFVNKSIGPKVIMIRNMLLDILFFLSIFVIFLMAYGTLSQALRFPNSPFGLTLIKDIVYIPYFQTYGELMLENFEVSATCNTTICILQNGTVTFSFAIFLLMSNVLLVNLLIAMFGYTFNQIQEDSEKFWCFIRIQLVQEFYDKPILPPPLNVLYYAFLLVIRVYEKCFQKVVQHENNLLNQVLDSETNLKISSFEQFCMEAVMLEQNSQNMKQTETTNPELNITELLDKLNLKSEQPAPLQIESVASFQLRTNRRLEKIEKNMDKREFMIQQ